MVPTRVLAIHSVQMWVRLKFGALAIAAILFTLPQVHAEAPKPTANASSSGDERVNISGGLSGTEVQSGHSILFWVTIENGSKASLGNLTVQLDVAQDEFTVTCPPCAPLKYTLTKNQSITVRGELTALKNTESRNITAIVSFDSVSPGVPLSTSSVRGISLGPLIGRSWELQAFQTYKDLLLPIVVFGATWYLTSKQAKVQTQRAQVAETWNRMLPISHGLATRYYMPMVKALLRVSEDVPKFVLAASPSASPPLPAPTNEGLSVYFHTMLFWCRFKRTNDKKGGIYFKNRTGEKLIVAAFHEFRKIYKGDGPGRFDIERRIRAIAIALTPELEFPEFVTAYNAAAVSNLSQAFKDGWVDFLGWYSDAAKRTRGLELLEIFRKILDFESNRPYQKWYNSLEKLEISNSQRDLMVNLAASGEERAEFAYYFKQAVKGSPD